MKSHPFMFARQARLIDGLIDGLVAIGLYSRSSFRYASSSTGCVGSGSGVGILRRTAKRNVIIIITVLCCKI